MSVYYTAIEAFPLEEVYWRELNYPTLADAADRSELFAKIHMAAWNEPVKLTPQFTLHKINGTIEAHVPPGGFYNLVYFDAFGPDAQPELWTEPVFRNLGMGISPGGILVTYSVKGIVVRALHAAGFDTEKLPGPPGKRHILRAIKI